MDLCELICILSMVMKVPPSGENLACSYCTSVDGLSSECAQDPINCWHMTSKELLYCLTTFEFRKTIALKTRRCVEHSLFPVDTQTLQQMIQTTECTFKSARACNCSTCALSQKDRPHSDDFVDPNFYENAYDNPLVDLSNQGPDHFHSKAKNLRNKTKTHNLEFWQSGGTNIGLGFSLFCTVLIVSFLIY